MGADPERQGDDLHYRLSMRLLSCRPTRNMISGSAAATAIQRQ